MRLGLSGKRFAEFFLKGGGKFFIQDELPFVGAASRAGHQVVSTLREGTRIGSISIFSPSVPPKPEIKNLTAEHAEDAEIC